MNEPAQYDSAIISELDAQIIRCLQLSPRAGFAELADVLDVSEQTVARRYRRLRRDGLLRIVAAVDPQALGLSSWMVRMRCRPDGALAVAQALARRDDVSWVTINAGGAEVSFALRSRTDQAREDLLVRRLPKSAPVLDVRAALILHRFAGTGSDDWPGLRATLSAEQAARLAQPERAYATRAVRLEPGDHALLDLLGTDGRAATASLARATGMSPGRIARRISTLEQSGVVFFDVDIALAVIGPTAGAALWLSVAPSQLTAVGIELGRFDEVQFAAAVTGSTNLTAAVNCADLAGLYGFVTDTLARIDAITGYELSPVASRVKQAGALVHGDRLAPPA